MLLASEHKTCDAGELASNYFLAGGSGPDTVSKKRYSYSESIAECQETSGAQLANISKSFLHANKQCFASVILKNAKSLRCLPGQTAIGLWLRTEGCKSTSSDRCNFLMALSDSQMGIPRMNPLNKWACGVLCEKRKYTDEGFTWGKECMILYARA